MSAFQISKLMVFSVVLLQIFNTDLFPTGIKENITKKVNEWHFFKEKSL